MTILRVCKKYFQNNYGKLIIFTGLAMISQLFGLLMPYLIGSFIDGLNRNQTLDFVLKYCLAFLVFSLLGLLLNYIINLLYVNLQMSSVYLFNTNLVFHVQQAPISYSEGKDLAHLNQQINTDVNVLIMFTLGVLQNFIANLFILPIVISVCVILNSLVASVLLAFSVLYIFLFLTTKKLLFLYDYTCKEAQSHFFGRMYEQLANIRFVKENSAENFFRERLDTPYQELYKATINSQKFLMVFGSLDSVIGFALQIALFLLGGYSILSGRFSIGLFVMFSSYFSIVMSCLRYFLSFGKEYESASVSLKRLLDIQYVPEEKTGAIKINECQTIKVQHLTFRYSETDQEVFQDICCTFSKGKTSCLVGHNGAGKSTLIGLLLGLYNEKYPKGCIWYDDYDLQDLDTSYLRKNLISVVAQAPYTFAGTLWDNLLLKNPTLAQYQRVEKLVDIFDLPKSLLARDVPIQGLSNGEQQKISIIRAFLRDTPIMILDEPTSSLDTKSGKALMELIDKSKENKIIILVSHDLSVIQQCDTVVHFS